MTLAETKKAISANLKYSSDNHPNFEPGNLFPGFFYSVRQQELFAAARIITLIMERRIIYAKKTNGWPDGCGDGTCGV